MMKDNWPPDITDHSLGYNAKVKELAWTSKDDWPWKTSTRKTFYREGDYLV